MTIETYLAIALLATATDGTICYVMRRKFAWLPSLLLALVWPVSLIYVVWVAVETTKHFQEW